MAAREEIGPLRVRKQLLLLESEMNRQVLRLELAQLQHRTEPWRRGWERLRTGWTWLAPLAGFLAARKFQRLPGLISQGSTAFLVLRRLWEGWRRARP